MNGRTLAVGGVAVLGAALAATLNWWSGAGPPLGKAPPTAGGAPASAATAPMPEFAEPPRFIYQGAAKRSPFASDTGGERAAQHQAGPVVAQDPNGAKQPLAAVDLSELTLVGIISYRGRRCALVRDGADQLHRLAVGDRLGMRQGRVQRIGDAWLELVEMVPNGRGGWAERTATLGVSDEAAQT